MRNGLVMWCAVLGIAFMASAALAQPRMLPREGVTDDTVLAHRTQSGAVIVVPRDAAYASLVQRIQDAIEARGHQPLEVRHVPDILVERFFLPDELKQRHLILLGNLNDNRAMVQLGANFHVYSTLAWPGPGGFEYRTATNPFGTKANAVILGGSDMQGVSQAVDQLVASIAQAQEQGDALILPRQMTIIVKGVDQRTRPAEGLKFGDTLNGTYRLSAAVERYQVTGSEAQRHRVRQLLTDYLQADAAPVATDYGTESGIRALDLVDSFLLSPEENLRMDNLVLDWVVRIIREKPYWNIQGRRRVFGAHQTAGVMSFQAAIHYLLKNGNPNEEARALLEKYRQGALTYLNYLSTSFKDRQKDVGWETWHALSVLPRYALAEQDMTYFDSGTAQQVVRRFFYAAGKIGVVRNRGAAPMAIMAYLYNDGRYKTLDPDGATLNGWAFVMRGPRWVTPDSLQPAEPDFLVGTHVMASNHGDWEVARRAKPDAQAAWYTTLPYEKTFHAIGFHEGGEADELLAVLAGWDSPGEPGEANSLRLLRRRGQPLLERADGEDQRRPRPGRMYQNSLLVESALSEASTPSAASQEGHHHGPRVGLAVGRIRDFQGVDWKRHILWRRGDTGYFVILDTCEAHQAGPLSIMAQWWSPQSPVMDGQRWLAATDQGRLVFMGADVGQIVTGQAWEGGPHYLRQRKFVQARQGQRIEFANLALVDDPLLPATVEVRKPAPGLLLIRGRLHDSQGQPRDEIALAGTVDYHDERLTIQQGGMFFLSPSASAWLSGSQVQLDGRPLVVQDNEALAPDDAKRLGDHLEQLWNATPQAKPEPAVVAAAPSASTEAHVSLGERHALPIARGGVPVVPASFKRQEDGTVEWRFDPPVHLAAIEGIRSEGKALAFEYQASSSQADAPWQRVEAPYDLLTPWVYYQYGYAAKLGIGRAGGLDITASAVRTPAGQGNPPYGRFIVGHWHRQAHNVTGMNPDLFNRPYWTDIVFRTHEPHVRYTRTTAWDLDGDGSQEVIAATDQHELLALDAQGRLLWKRAFPAQILNLMAHDLAGQPAVLVATHDHRLHVLDGQGNDRLVIDTLQEDEQGNPLPGRSDPMTPETGQALASRSDIGLSRGVNAMSIVRRPDGNWALAVATYHQIRLYDLQGRRLNITNMNGFYLDAMPPVSEDLNGDGEPDLLTRDNVWGQVGLADGATFKPVASTNTFSGRGLGTVLWPGDEPGRPRRVLSVAESGVAMLQVTGKGTSTHGDATLVVGGLSKVFGLPLPGLTAWKLATIGGATHIVVATSPGSVLLLDETGRIVKRAVVDAMVHDLTMTTNHQGQLRFVLATDRGIHVLDQTLAVIAHAAVPGADRGMALETLELADGTQTIVALLADGTSAVVTLR